MSSVYVISAMCGCWRRESGVNPGIWESLIPCAWNYVYEYTGKGGFGLGQWTNVGTTGDRLLRLHNWVTSHGYADGSGPGQIAYIPVEGFWGGAYNGTADNPQSHGHYGGLQAFLNSDSTDIETLTWDFLANWEGVPGDHFQERLGYAKSFLSYLQEHGGEQGSWTSVNNYISVSQMNNNVLAIYNLLSGETPEPPTPEPDTYPITVFTSGNGTAFASKSYAAVNEVITVTAEPGTGATFRGWNVLTDNTTIENNQFVMPDSGVSIEAVFSGAYGTDRYPIWLLYQWDRLRRSKERK